MNKLYSQSAKSHENNRQNYSSPTRFPKKQFQLIYREKEHLPSSEAYENIIFMKSKKCDNKQMSKTTSKGKKTQVDNLKKVISKIERQIKQEHAAANRKDEEAIKSAILKNKTNIAHSSKKASVDSYKNKPSQRINKYQKGEVANQNIKKYRNIVSPTRNSKLKISEPQTASSQFIKTSQSQQTFRKEPKSKQKKNKKIIQTIFAEEIDFNDEPQQYVLIQNNFVEVNPQDASVLNEKLITNRQDNLFHFEKKQNPYSHFQKPSYDCDEPIIEDEDAEKVFQAHLRYQSSKSSQKNGSFHSVEENTQNNLIVVQNYFICKIKIIQKWWRSVLAQKKISNAEDQQSQECKVMVAAESDLFEGQNTQSIVFGECTPIKDQVINTSPIKLVDDFGENFGMVAGDIQIIIQRQNAAKMQFETHKEMLQKLLMERRIKPEVYLDRKQLIEARYYEQLQQIEELRRLLRNNADKMAEIQKKAEEDRKILEDTEVQVDNALLDRIFGHDSLAESREKNILKNMPILHTSDQTAQRQKSTGCHYHSQQPYRASLYKKNQAEEEQYKQDFQECQESSEQIHVNQFIGNNVHGQADNNNFRQLFDEFKLREEVKMEIDRRAAIQMGVLAQEIPSQIKDQFINIDTSLSSIHRFILSFFKYYIFYYKYDFLRLINMPFGFNIEKRIKMLQGYSDDDQGTEEDEDGVIYGLESVIPEDIFDEFYEKIYDMGNQNISTAKKTNFQIEKIHNRAIFDCFNQALNVFRPYFIINGPPFPWTNSQTALTFYFIAEENVQQVFEKTQFKVLKWASTLCGIIVNKYSNPLSALEGKESPDEIIEKYQQSNHPLLNETRQDRLIKNERTQIQDNNYEWMAFEDQKTINLFESAEMILSDLIGELYAQMFADVFSNEIDCPVKQLQHVSANSSLSEFELC